MRLKTMYITNSPDVAKTAQQNGVDRIWIDLETLGKAERQGNIDSVKSHHTIEDIAEIAPLLTSSEMLVRVNPINPSSEREINDVIAAGAEIVMLPMWRTAQEVRTFLNAVGGHAKTTLLLETKEAAEILPEIMEIGGFDEIHIGLNDLHLSYGLTFMFELLSNGTVERLCDIIRPYGIPYGFGGIAAPGSGTLRAEKILSEHFRLGSERVILSRSFCCAEKIEDKKTISDVFEKNMNALRDCAEKLEHASEAELEETRNSVRRDIERIVINMRRARQWN